MVDWTCSDSLHKIYWYLIRGGRVDCCCCCVKDMRLFPGWVNYKIRLSLFLSSRLWWRHGRALDQRGVQDLEEEHPISVWSGHDPCSGVAKFDCPMVARCYQVRKIYNHYIYYYLYFQTGLITKTPRSISKFDYKKGILIPNQPIKLPFADAMK